MSQGFAIFQLMLATPHGAELFELDAVLAKSEAGRLDAGFTALLVRRAEAAAKAGADLATFGGPAEFAAFMSITAAGIKYETRTEDAYRTAIRRLSHVIAAAAGKNITAESLK